jgi:hypothetical protein
MGAVGTLYWKKVGHCVDMGYRPANIASRLVSRLLHNIEDVVKARVTVHAWLAHIFNRLPST